MPDRIQHGRRRRALRERAVQGRQRARPEERGLEAAVHAQQRGQPARRLELAAVAAADCGGERRADARGEGVRRQLRALLRPCGAPHRVQAVHEPAVERGDRFDRRERRADQQRVRRRSRAQRHHHRRQARLADDHSAQRGRRAACSRDVRDIGHAGLAHQHAGLAHQQGDDDVGVVCPIQVASKDRVGHGGRRLPKRLLQALASGPARRLLLLLLLLLLPPPPPLLLLLLLAAAVGCASPWCRCYWCCILVAVRRGIRGAIAGAASALGRALRATWPLLIRGGVACAGGSVVGCAAAPQTRSPRHCVSACAVAQRVQIGGARVSCSALGYQASDLLAACYDMSCF